MSDRDLFFFIAMAILAAWAPLLALARRVWRRTSWDRSFDDLYIPWTAGVLFGGEAAAYIAHGDPLGLVLLAMTVLAVGYWLFSRRRRGRVAGEARK